MSKFGTFERPFAADSLWNSRPVNPVLGTWMIPPSFNPRGSTNKSFPIIQSGEFSTGVFRALETDPPCKVFGSTSAGIFDVDADENKVSITIAHWPADAVGAEGGDGHCEVVDEAAGVVHSFWQLKKDATGRFTAKQYGWSPLDGTGFGDAVHYYQGARAAGVPTIAGLIRKHEANDGKPLFEHALACSLDHLGLASSPAFIPPATAADWDAHINTGKIPEGALLMLPPGYDTARLARWPLLKKVAETLKVYGMRVVDRNAFAPYAIYVETGASWKMTTELVWDSPMATELDYIRTQLRQVLSQSGFIAGEEAKKAKGIMSLRGPWRNEKTGGSMPGIYDTHVQGLRFPDSTASIGVGNGNGSGFRVPGLKPKPGDYLKLSINADCAARLTMNVYGKNADGTTAPTTKLEPVVGDFAYVKWPLSGWCGLTVWKSAGPGGVLTCALEPISEAEYLAAKKT